jgi:hypothetical protein
MQLMQKYWRIKEREKKKNRYPSAALRAFLSWRPRPVAEAIVRDVSQNGTLGSPERSRNSLKMAAMM